MTKSQLLIRLSSKKTNRHVSPVVGQRKSLRLNSFEPSRITFVRAKKYVEYLLDSAVRDAGSVDCWTSTHLVTLEVRVSGPIGEYVAVEQRTLNGSALCLLQRYLQRFERNVVERSEARNRLWLDCNFKWLPISAGDQAIIQFLREYE